jgi:inorganic triphosphatase YgiF
MKTRETEIVFSASAEQIERLPRVLRELAAMARARPARAIEDRYLDTPTRLLMRAGVACRLRQAGARATLTLKSLTPFRDGLAERVEWSEELRDGDWTGPGPLPGTELRTRLLPLARRLEVACLFELRQARRVYDVTTRDGARLEVSADRTWFAGFPPGDPLERIEVELREGPVEALTRFAAGLRRALKLKPARESKFEYALRAAGLSLPVPAAGPALRIRPRDTVRRAAARALARHLRGLLWNAPGARLGVNPECLHDMRVSARRLRAVLRLFRGHLPPATAAKLAEELKWLGQSLGAVRDLDVHLQECAALRRRPGIAPASDACHAEMNRRRERAYKTLHGDLRNARFRAIPRACRDLIRRLRRPTAAGRATIASRGAEWLRRDLGKILKAGRAIAADTPAAALHRLRIRCKRLRYDCETLRDLYGKPVSKMARRLAALQDVLGAHQDAVAAQALIERAAAESSAAPDAPALSPAFVCCAAAWREEQLARRAAFPEAWRAFDRKKPRRAFLKVLRQTGRG